jgi:hypothetical protein
MGLMEMAEVNEQEHMREALRRAAIREARKQAGVTWIQVVRARLFGHRDGAAAAASAATPAAAAAPAVATSTPVDQEQAGRPALVHEIRIRQHAGPASSSAARASAPAPKLRVVEAAELDCVGADC